MEGEEVLESNRYDRFRRDEDGKVGVLSVSKVAQFWQCQRKTYYEDFLGIKPQVNGSSIKGQAIDSAVQKVLLEKSSSGREPPINDTLDFAIAEFERIEKEYSSEGPGVKWKAEDGDTPEKAKSDISRGLPFLLKSEDGVASIDPHPDNPVQDSFEITLPSGLSIVGTVDVIGKTPDGGYHITDIKTAGRSWPERKEYYSLQPVVYTLGMSVTRGSMPSSFDFRILSFNKVTPKVERRVVNVTKERLRKLPMIFEQTARAIERLENGKLPPPTGYLSQGFICNYCGHAKLCREDGLPI